MSRRLLFGVSVLWIPLAFMFDGVTVLMLPIRLGGEASDVGLVSFAGLMIGALLQPIVGWLSDRWRAKVDRRLFAAVAAVPAILGIWLLAGSSGVLPAILGYVAVQAAAAGVQASQQTLIPEYVDGPGRGRSSGLKTAFDVGGAFLAFAILGGLLADGNLVPAAIVTTVVLLGATLMMLALVPARSRVARRSTGPLTVPRELVPLLAARLLFLLGIYAVGRFLLLLVADRLGIPADRAADEAGGLLVLFTLSTAVVAVAAGWLAERWRTRDLMACGALVGGVGIGVLVPQAGVVGLIVGGLLMSAGTAVFMTANWTATVDVVPAHEAGRLMGIANLSTALAAATAGLAGVWIAAAGFVPVLVAAALVSVAAVIPLTIAPRRAGSAVSPT